jgi:valyl-tRNA synthetase
MLQAKPTNDFISIATQRPETIMGDTAVCVHPEDERYAYLKGEESDRAACKSCSACNF